MRHAVCRTNRSGPSVSRRQLPLPADAGTPPLPPAPRKGGIPTLAVVASCVLIVAAAVLVMDFSVPSARAREVARRAGCQGNLEQVPLVCKAYAGAQPNSAWPPLSAERGKLMFEASAVYPKWMSEPMFLVCPSDPDAPSRENAKDPADLIDDHSYYYLGYVVLNEEEGLAFLQAYENTPELASLANGDIPAPEGLGSGGGNAFLRLREGIEIPNPEAPGENLNPAKIPVMFEDAENHAPDGGNVLYMDGHVEFVLYPYTFPMTPAFIDAIRKVAGKAER